MYEVLEDGNLYFLGESSKDANGIYGNRSVPAATNWPGSRTGHTVISTGSVEVQLAQSHETMPLEMFYVYGGEGFGETVGAVYHTANAVCARQLSAS